LDARVGVDIKDIEGGTPLHYATAARKGVALTMLLEQRAHVNDVDNDGVSCLHLAAKDGFADVVALLLQAGASVNLCDKSGGFPAQCACEDSAAKADQSDTLRLLSSYGADLSLSSQKVIRKWMIQQEVILHSLNALDLNGKSGKVACQGDAGRWGIDVHGLGRKSIKPSNLALCKAACYVGDRVILHGLSEPELNGRVGIVKRAVGDDSWIVDIDGSGEQQHAIKNLAPILV